MRTGKAFNAGHPPYAGSALPIDYYLGLPLIIHACCPPALPLPFTIVPTYVVPCLSATFHASIMRMIYYIMYLLSTIKTTIQKKKADIVYSK